jgi:hypothetical protein
MTMNVKLKPLWEQVIVVFGASTGIARITALEACRRRRGVVSNLRP